MIYLYVKQHQKTGLKYFGMTQKNNPYIYKGSGKYWKSHIKTHGTKFVHTLDVWEFDNFETASNFAIEFSIKNNIIESNEWANLMIENCESGVVMNEEIRKKISQTVRDNYTPELREHLSKMQSGKKHSKETKEKIRSSRLGKPKSPETKAKMSEAAKNRSVETRNNISQKLKGRKLSDDQKSKMSESRKGKRHSKETKSKMSLTRTGMKYKKSSRLEI